jgi:tRNA(Ile)-lysidine synthetase-like protein
MPKTLLISSLSEGERMIPFGGKKEVKLKKLFEDKKISSAEKSGYPVFRLFDKMTIIWVGGIRRSNFAPAKQGKEVLMINIGGVNI